MSRQSRFEEDGFVVVPGFCDAEEVQGIESTLTTFIAEIVPSLPVEQVFYEDKNEKSTLKQIQRMHEHDAFFAAFFEGKPRQLAEELLNESVVGKNMQYFNKPPGMGKATPAHQDGKYFMLEPCHALTMWMALDPVDEENGCVRYLRGSHRDGLRSHGRTQTLGFSQGITDYGGEESQEEVPCPAQPGDLLAHHALTVHRADANLSSTRSRRALGFIFYGQSAREDTDAHEEYQRSLAKELKVSGRI